MKKLSRRLIFISALLMLSLSQTAPAAANDSAKDVTPSINTQFLPELVSHESSAVVLIKNASTFFSTWKENPLVKIWHNKQLQQQFKPLKVSMQQPRWERWSKEMSGYSIDELMSLFSGQIMISIPDFPTTDAVQFIADIGSKQQDVINALDSYMRYLKSHLQEGEQYIEEQESFLTTETYTRTHITSEQSKEHFSWAIVDGFLVVSNSKNRLQELILTLDENNLENNLSESNSFETMANAHGEYDWLVYVNNSLLSSVIQEIFHSMDEVDEVDEVDGEEQMFGDIPDYFNGAGFDSFYITARQDEEQTIMNVSTYHQADSALMKLFKVEPQEMQWPVFIDGEPLTASISLFNFSNFWQQFMSQPETSPFAGYVPMIRLQLNQLSASSGVDFEQALTEGLGQTVYSASYKMPIIDNSDEDEDELNANVAENYFYAVTLLDQQSVNLALNAIKKEYNFTPFFSEKKYLDSSIQIYNPYAYKDFSEVNSVFAYVLTDNLLLISNYVPLLENAVSQIRDENTQQSFASKDEIIELMSSLPNNVTGITYTQGPSFLTTSRELLSMLQLIALPAPEQNSCRMRPQVEMTEERTESNIFNNVLKSVYYTSYNDMNVSRFTVTLKHF